MTVQPSGVQPSTVHRPAPSVTDPRWPDADGVRLDAWTPDGRQVDGGRLAPDGPAGRHHATPDARKDPSMPERDSATVSPSTPPATVHTMGARIARMLLVGTVILGSVAISVGAAWVSFLSIRDLALYFGWDQHTAWVVMPLIELFLLVGSAEAALRILGGISHPVAPYVAAYSALVVTLACNIGDHVLRLYDGQPGVARWRLVILGAFAAIVPTAQIGALHFLSGRLRRIAEGRQQRAALDRPAGPRYGRLIAEALGQRALDAIKPTVHDEPDVPSTPPLLDGSEASSEPDAPPSTARPLTVRPSTPVRVRRPSGPLHLVPEEFSDTVRSNAAKLRERYPDGLPEWQGKPSGRTVRKDMGWSNDKASPAIRAYLAGADLEPSTTEEPSA